MAARLASVALFVALVAICDCWDYSVDLPNGYRLVRLNSYEVAIVLPDNRMLIDPDVRRYAISGSVVAGFAEVPKSLPQQPPPPRQQEGYFIVNTETGDVWDSLSQEAWLERLRLLGIESELKLKRPSPFD